MDIWDFIKKEISQNYNTVLITVVERIGSSPGIVGFKMAVSESGAMNGSIGGGSMEYNMVELARKIVGSGHEKPTLKKQIHNPEAGKDKSGLICSGEQTHVFIPVSRKQKDIITTINEVLGKGNNGVLEINQDGMFFNEKEVLTEKVRFEYKNESDWKFSEQIGLKPTVYIFGAGHVSLPTSEIFRFLDFNVVLYDNRKELLTFEKNQYTHRKEIIDYKKASDYVVEGEYSYVIIMTVAHKSDELILKQLVSKKLKYIGMIGSKNKVKAIFESLRKQNISREELAKVDAPIGLPINSETAPEIAVSIAAKVIVLKNEK